MSKFIRFTCDGDPRIVNADKIHMIDFDSKSSKVALFLSDCMEPWTVDQSFDEVVNAISSCVSIYDAVSKQTVQNDDIYDALSKFARLNPHLEVTVETDHGTISAKLGDCNIYEAYDHAIIFDAE